MKCWVGVFLALACLAQPEAPETLLLARIKAKVTSWSELHFV